MDKSRINKIIDDYKDEMIETLAEFVSINTIYDETTADKNNPFGKGVSKGLEYFYNLAKKDGFEVVNYDNYCVEVTYGEGEYFDILAHCDVVEVSDKWNFSPFSKFYDDKYVYGRGTQDDKGPLLAAYYALKAIKDNSIKSNKKIRFIVGGNEESGSKCLEYYYKNLKKPYPEMGFTPDAAFPVINGEKGIVHLKLIHKNIDKRITSIAGGRALNIVMDEVEINEDGNKKVYYGKAAHASMPEKGVNAFIAASKELSEKYPEFTKIYNDFSSCDGKGLNINTYEEKLGKLTMNVGKVELINNDLIIKIDIRYPLSIDVDTIKNRIEEKGYICEVLNEDKPLYVDENSKLITALIDSYDYFKETKSKAFTIGGGTYAKSSKNVVAFGMLFDDDVDLMHQNDEKISIKNYLLGSKIYLKALLELIK